MNIFLFIAIYMLRPLLSQLKKLHANNVDQELRMVNLLSMNRCPAISAKDRDKYSYLVENFAIVLRDPHLGTIRQVDPSSVYLMRLTECATIE
jgi:hypothetical protein